jgi:V/A-type H+-transporting ATPase subunit B
VRQGDHENRSIEESLQIGWTLLSMLPKSELKRIRADHIEAYYQGASGVAEA